MKNLILTCGPACRSDAMLQMMGTAAAGFRLNSAHLSAAELDEWLNKIELLRVASGKPYRIVIDLQGAKVRIGKYPDVATLPAEVELFAGEVSDDARRIPVPCPSVFAQSFVGDQLFINDRKIVLRVIAKAHNKLQALVEQHGPLSSGKGLNSPDRVFEMARVTEGDRQAILRSRHFGNIAYAISFVADGSESALFKPLTLNIPLIAKIEQRAAFAHLQAINNVFDELWLCRGDLGAEAGFKELGKLQNEFVEAIGKSITRPALIAGEVLGSMVVMPHPSRAEIVQLYDCMKAGFAGLVLSDETACGQQVPAVVEFLRHFFS